MSDRLYKRCCYDRLLSTFLVGPWSYQYLVGSVPSEKDVFHVNWKDSLKLTAERLKEQAWKFDEKTLPERKCE